nr:DUF4192 family protein [Rhodococcus sp. (in: high G+C Gram-positive bacteria)]
MTQHRMSLTTAADTLAAIPALLGFTPDNSVVIIALADDGNGSHLVAPTARVDAHQAEAAAGIITDALTRQNTPITAVILAAIADTTHAGAALLGLDAIRDALAAAGIRTIRALHTYSLTAGTAFTDLDRFTDGTIPDPATTALATARTADGAVIAASRADLEARYAPTTEIPESLALAAAATMGADFLPVTFDELAAVIHAREIPSADLTARVGLALATGHLEVRDAFLAMSVHGDADAADAFTRIAGRATRHRPRERSHHRRLLPVLHRRRRSCSRSTTGRRAHRRKSQRAVAEPDGNPSPRPRRRNATGRGQGDRRSHHPRLYRRPHRRSTELHLTPAAERGHRFEVATPGNRRSRARGRCIGHRALTPTTAPPAATTEEQAGAVRSGVAEKERNSAQRDVGRAGHAISTSAAGGRVSSTRTPATIASSASSDGGGSAFTTALDKTCSIRERSIPQHPTDQHEHSHRYECSDTERERFFSIRLTAQRECITRPLPDQPLTPLTLRPTGPSTTVRPTRTRCAPRRTLAQARH